MDSLRSVSLCPGIQKVLNKCFNFTLKHDIDNITECFSFRSELDCSPCKPMQLILAYLGNTYLQPWHRHMIAKHFRNIYLK